MGYRRKTETLVLKYTGELQGLEVEARHTSPEATRSILATAQAAGDGSDLLAQAKAILDLCDAFGGLLVSWNLEDDRGQPVPCTAQALARQDVSFVLAIVYGWLDGVATRAEQLTQAAQVDEADLPMEVTPA